ncbi:MAG: DNA alkylation repair protein [Marinilabiliaceae bacterium]
MKFFPLNPEIDKTLKPLMVRLWKLRDGEIREQMERAGALYKENWGVSVVHLKNIASELQQNQDLARRLWYREIRETMIVATMLADVDQMSFDELDEWGKMLSASELSEQMGRNLLSDPRITESFLIAWLENGSPNQKHAAAMAVGWRLRFYPEAGFGSLNEVFPLLKEQIETGKFSRAGAFVLKMAGRFSKEKRDEVLSLIHEWKQDENMYLRQVADEAREEIELFL